MNISLGFENPNFLRGGWFVGPEEYEQMGYTLGLPPGYFAPDLPEIRNLVEKLKSQNGIILPSSIEKQTEQPTKKKVIVTNVPTEMSPDQLGELLTQTLLKRKLITNPEPIENIDLAPGKTSAFVAFKQQKDAEAAIQIGKTFIYNNRQLRILWYKSKREIAEQASGEEADDIDEVYTYRNNYESMILETESDHLPSTESILQAFNESGFPIDQIVVPDNFNHAIIYLEDPSSADLVVYKLNGTTIQDVVIKLKKCYIGENEGPNDIPDKEKRRLKATNGPSPLVSIMNPLLLQNSSIADILNPEVISSVIVQPETELIQPNVGNVLCMYNIVKDVTLYDQELLTETLQDLESECVRFGEIIDKKVEHMPIRSEYAVVKFFYKTPQQAKNAQIALAGRRYAGRAVLTSVETQ